MKLSAKAQKVLGRVVEQFKTGDLSPIVKIVQLRRTHAVPFDRWSFGNRVLAYIQTGSADLRGYRQWQQAGRQVQKGSTAAFIWAPRIKKETDDDDNETTRVIGFLSVAVFPDYATEGDPIPGNEQPPAELSPLADIAEKMGITIHWTPSPASLGNCNLDGTKITLGTHDAEIFFHELAHAAHARIDGLRPGQHTDQETVAEFTAAVLMTLYGLGDRTGNAWRYIQSYSDNPLTAIQRALSTVEKVLILLEVV
jgi:hypothetical protein